MSDYKMLLGAGPEKAVASTKALTGILSHLVLLACAIDSRIKRRSTVFNKICRVDKNINPINQLKLSKNWR